MISRTSRSLNTADIAPTRKISVIAQDPSVKHGSSIVMATIDIPAEDLSAGPIGYRVQIVDYDASSQTFNGAHRLPASLTDEPSAWRNGDRRILSDGTFHAQNVYALIMKTLARFEFALGRRIPWSFGTHQLKVAPHGIRDANAFYSPEAEGLVFGYFDGASNSKIYTCLSHDIVVHETTHALLDALRERYMDPSTPDQAAFHEGFADVIALLSVFSQIEIIEHLLASGDTGGSEELLISRDSVSFDALMKTAIFGLAEEMGGELEGVRGKPLRRSATILPTPTLKDSPEFMESHKRGELFVAAVLRGFVRAWSEGVMSMGRTAQKEFPLRRVAREGADIAETLVTMWIRAIDYMPPVHLTFGDALSAALTADTEVRPDDFRYQLRARMLEAFAEFGFKPASKQKGGLWDPPPEGLEYHRVRFESMRSDRDEVFRFIWENRHKLRLQDGAYTQVLSVRPSTRIGVDGFVVRETVAQYYQVARLTGDEMKSAGIRVPKDYLRMLTAEKDSRSLGDTEDTAGDTVAEAQEIKDIEADTTPLYGGAVLIFDEYGRVKYWVHNNVFSRKQSQRLAYLWNEGLLQPGRRSARLRATRLSALHRLRALGSQDTRSETW